MNAPRNWILLSLAMLALVGGCGRNQQTIETATDTTALAPPPVSTPEPTASGAPAWVAELRQGEAALGQIVEQGRLGRVMAVRPIPEESTIPDTRSHDT